MLSVIDKPRKVRRVRSVYVYAAARRRRCCHLKQVIAAAARPVSCSHLQPSEPLALIRTNKLAAPEVGGCERTLALAMRCGSHLGQRRSDCEAQSRGERQREVHDCELKLPLRANIRGVNNGLGFPATRAIRTT